MGIFEGVAGCTTSSTFIQTVDANTSLLIMSISPVLVIMPHLMLFFGVLDSGRIQVKFLEHSFWPFVERHQKLAKLLPRIAHSEARRLYYYWKNRLVFSWLMFMTFATFIMTSLSVSALYVAHPLACGCLLVRQRMCMYKRLIAHTVTARRCQPITASRHSGGFKLTAQSCVSLVQGLFTSIVWQCSHSLAL